MQEYNDLSDLNTFEQAMFYKMYPDVTSFAKACLADEEVQQGLVKDLGMGLLFSAFGLIPLMTGNIRKKQQAEGFLPVEDNDTADSTIESTIDLDDDPDSDEVDA